MVNKTLLPPSPGQPKHLTHSSIDIFSTGTAFALSTANRGLGRAWQFGTIRYLRPGRALGRGSNLRGEPPMENMLLVGLSRQMTLERQMDVVANNVANVNTNGYKADRSLFEEYLRSGAHEDNFVSRDRAVSFVQDNGTFKDFTQGPTEQTKNPLDVAIDGGGFL